MVPRDEFSRIDSATFTAPAYRAVHDAVVVAGGPPAAPDAGWAERVREHAPSPIAGLVTELAVTPIPANDVARYARDIVLGLRELQIGRAKANLHSRLQRAEPDEQAALLTQLMELEQQRRALREE
jgi:DNA primase